MCDIFFWTIDLHCNLSNVFCSRKYVLFLTIFLICIFLQEDGKLFKSLNAKDALNQVTLFNIITESVKLY